MRGERDTTQGELNQLKDELAARDRFIDNLQKQLEEKENGGGDDRALAANLQKVINGWDNQSKNTRDWTKANQLISELKNLI